MYATAENENGLFVGRVLNETLNTVRVCTLSALDIVFLGPIIESGEVMDFDRERVRFFTTLEAAVQAATITPNIEHQIGDQPPKKKEINNANV